MSIDKSKLRILALHGYRQSDVIFRSKLGSLRKSFKKDIEFVFINAPHEVPPDEAGEENAGYGWWFNTEDRVFKATVPSELCIGFDSSVATIEKAFTELGPFDGLLGFSQGAAFVSILCAMKERQTLKIEFDFAIIISGFKSLCAPHVIYYKEELAVHSLHVYGNSDKIIPKEMTEQISHLFIDKIEIQHEGGHYVPSKKAFYNDFLSALIVKKHTNNKR